MKRYGSLFFVFFVLSYLWLRGKENKENKKENKKKKKKDIFCFGKFSRIGGNTNPRNRGLRQ